MRPLDKATSDRQKISKACLQRACSLSYAMEALNPYSTPKPQLKQRIYAHRMP
jgi:hypothetical protein